MELIQSLEVEKRLTSYPAHIGARLYELRELIIETARTEGVKKLMETTKWGEPSYVSKHGSTIRMDWKERTPEKYYLYFICSTSLVETFRVTIGDELIYHGNRAIELTIDTPLPAKLLTKCISLALNYHNLKHLPLLGA